MQSRASGNRSAGRKVLITVLSLLLIAAAGTAAWLLYPKPAATTGSGVITTVTPGATVSVVDPPIVAPAAKIKAVAVAGGKVPTAAGVSKILAPALADPNLAQYTGVVIDAATGKVLWSKDPASATQPASSQKLLTGAALLTTVDPNSRFTTRVVEGDAAGDVIFVGGGDVTLSARPVGVGTVYDGAPTVADLAAQVLASGYPVKRILLDTSYWSGPETAEGWSPTDVPQGFVARMQALMVDGDRKDPSNENSSRSNQPAINAGKALARALGNVNIPVSSGVAKKGAAILAQVQSQPMTVLLAQALLNSDNVLAEALARQVALAKGAPPSFAGAVAAVGLALGDLKLDTVGMVMLDGSGLSTLDRAPVRLLADVMTLAVSGKVPVLRSLLAGLPVAGVSGTLSKAEGRFQSAPSKAGVGWVRAKTGKVDVTYAMVGYVPDVDGRILVFGLNSNGVTGPKSLNAQDVFTAQLRTCGC